MYMIPFSPGRISVSFFVSISGLPSKAPQPIYANLSRPFMKYNSSPVTKLKIL